MPSSSAAQHRFIGYLHSNPEARARSGMSQAKVDEWLNADRGSPWKHHAGGGGILALDGGGSVDSGGASPVDLFYSTTERAVGGPMQFRDGGLASGGDPNSLYYGLAQALAASNRPANTGAGTRDSSMMPAPGGTDDERAAQWDAIDAARAGGAGQDVSMLSSPGASRARGGILARGPGGMLPTPSGAGPAPSANNAGPQMQQAYKRLLSMSPEQLQELAVRMPPESAQGQLVQKALQLQHMQPQGQQQQQPQAPQQPPPQQQAPQPQQQPGILADTAPQQQARGGEVQHFDAGGSPLGVGMGMASPWWERQDARGMTSGYLRGDTAGRADNITTTAPGGSYVVPADVLAGIGEGNGEFGAKVLDNMLHSGPFGTRPPRGGRGMGPPRPPPPTYNLLDAAREPPNRPEAKGGGVQAAKQGIGQPVPVKLSHGEYVIAPHRVLAIGRHILRKHGGVGTVKMAMKAGHDFLDEFVKAARAKHIEKLKKLPGPTR